MKYVELYRYYKCHVNCHASFLSARLNRNRSALDTPSLNKSAKKASGASSLIDRYSNNSEPSNDANLTANSNHYQVSTVEIIIYYIYAYIIALQLVYFQLWIELDIILLLSYDYLFTKQLKILILFVS